ncbi:uncharacterized protein LOC121856259 [Homarus americanus]|uniref:uncharacterized protein LOC121856259 n=1 Tax=Homarus americanus TaxID=6706 RepID=UPI001C4462EC|nr:uncharacterized protein LOC121856259 [Homarus americanus]
MEVMLQKASWSDCQLKGNDPSPSSADPGPSSPVPGPSSADPGPSSADPGPARRFRKYMDLCTRSTGVKFINVEERQEPHVIFPGRQKCLNSSEPVPVNLPIFIHGTGRCENAMPEGFQPLDVDYREDESTDLCTESDSEEEGMVQRKLELESADSRVDVCEETQASELQDHTQREPKNDELITIIPETRDLGNVENLEDASESGESTSIEEYASPLKDDNTEAPIQKDSSDVDSSPEERQISYMATGQSKTKHRSVKYPKRALHEQYSTSPEEKNRQPRKRFQPLKNKKRSRFACDMSSPQSKIVIQRSISTNPDGNHVLQGASSVKPTRTTKSEEEYCLPTVGSKLGDQKRNEKSPRKIKPYKPYTRFEDEVILKWIDKHRLHTAVGGLLMWRTMQNAGVLQNRTMYGLKERFQKRILPRIDTYGLSEEAVKRFKGHRKAR